ncbi:uncharacterized protein LOC112464042 [Temnothorax curvispinosus]|uniref:Uncharacterized protein LOC112464042 n=2 Tax=Temnothorax TaxID=300110 RepID=A0A6J1QVF1_9HYME|nr:uncharacterized protein LOC112464042 [Temnothorax curvispinosus]TGZ50919.1 hypothetical protein DBV15_12070 [Temnothorax longispinosus]
MPYNLRSRTTADSNCHCFALQCNKRRHRLFRLAVPFPYGINKRLPAKECLDKICMHLVTPYLERRFAEPIMLRSYLRIGIGEILGKTQEPTSAERVELPSKKRCGLCKRGSDRKTKYQCPSCLRPMCDEHRTNFCTDCAGQE